MRMGPPIPLSTGRGTAGSPSRPSRPFCSDPHVYTRPSSLTHARWSSPQETCVTTTPCNSRSSRGTRSLSDAPSRNAGEGGSGHRVMGQGSSVQRSPRLVCVFEWLDWVVCVPVSHTAPSCYNWSSIWFIQVFSKCEVKYAMMVHFVFGFSVSLSPSYPHPAPSPHGRCCPTRTVHRCRVPGGGRRREGQR